MTSNAQGSSAQPSSESQGPDLAAIKGRQQAMWASGDFAVIGTTLQIVGEQLCEAVDLHGGQRVLDVACGNGNAALAAARRFGVVTGVDYVPTLLERARERAAAERLPIEFVEGDAEALPFPERSFATVLSTFGVMFAPDQERTARELTRVCARGGKIGLASWTPTGLIGELLKVVSAYQPPPKGLRPTVLWGVAERLQELFEDRARLVHAERKHFVFRYRSPAHTVEVFRRDYGPTRKAFEALSAEGQAQLERDMLQLLQRYNRAGDDTLAAPAEYLEAVLEVR